MTIEQVYMFDNNIYAFLLLGILLFIVLKKKDIYDFTRKLFYRMIIFNMALLLVEVLSWAFEGVDTTGALIANYFFNCALIVMEPIMAAMWLSYVDYKINNSKERLRKRWFYMYASIFAVILLVINIFTPVAFYIDDSNIYHRGPFLWLSLVFVFGLVLFTIVLAFKHRKQLSEKMIIFIAIFALLPVLVSFIQLFVYGLILTWAVVALGVVFAYYLIEISGNSIDYLTGLYSRKKIEEILTGKIESKEDFSVIMIDLENFKYINDKYGHKVGDEVLNQFSLVLQKICDQENFTSRIGGDEFLIVSKNRLDNPFAYRTILEDAIKQHSYANLHEIGISYGAQAFKGSETTSIDVVFDRVDILMYDDKRRNKTKRNR